MRFHKCVTFGGVNHGGREIRDSHGNIVATFNRSTPGDAAYKAFCKGLAKGDELYDSDYNRLIIGPLSEMVSEDQAKVA